MRWGTGRQTTRPEDMAYCLVGILNVTLITSYGEEPVTAFLRLQEAIINKAADETIFVWRSDNPGNLGLLAEAPDWFIDCFKMTRRPGPASSVTITSHGAEVLLYINEMKSAFTLVSMAYGKFARKRALNEVPLRISYVAAIALGRRKTKDSAEMQPICTIVFRMQWQSDNRWKCGLGFSTNRRLELPEWDDQLNSNCGEIMAEFYGYDVAVSVTPLVPWTAHEVINISLSMIPAKLEGKAPVELGFITTSRKDTWPQPVKNSKKNMHTFRRALSKKEIWPPELYYTDGDYDTGDVASGSHDHELYVNAFSYPSDQDAYQDRPPSAKTVELSIKPPTPVEHRPSWNTHLMTALHGLGFYDDSDNQYYTGTESSPYYVGPHTQEPHSHSPGIIEMNGEENKAQEGKAKLRSTKGRKSHESKEQQSSQSPTAPSKPKSSRKSHDHASLKRERHRDTSCRHKRKSGEQTRLSSKWEWNKRFQGWVRNGADGMKEWIFKTEETEETEETEASFEDTEPSMNHDPDCAEYYNLNAEKEEEEFEPAFSYDMDGLMSQQMHYYEGAGESVGAIPFDSGYDAFAVEPQGPRRRSRR
ncbi:heterokaryon incompatibility protein [Seiridium cupressi]